MKNDNCKSVLNGIIMLRSIKNTIVSVKIYSYVGRLSYEYLCLGEAAAEAGRES